MLLYHALRRLEAEKKAKEEQQLDIKTKAQKPTPKKVGNKEK